MAMDALPMDWAFRPAFDLELKQYTLLAYLQRVERRFDERRLYPHLTDLDAHISELERMRARKNRLAQELGAELTGFDARTGTAVHEPLAADELMTLLDDIITWAIPGLSDTRRRGMDMLDEIRDRIILFPIGLMPLDAHAGWLMLRAGQEARVYAYDVSAIHLPHEPGRERHVRTRYVTTYALGITTSYQWIKTDLLRNRPELPNPAVFVFESELSLPVVETVMPLAKRLIYDRVSDAA